jgi:hypothetical protein
VTLLIAAVGVIFLVVFIASVVWFRRATPFLIPSMFAVLLWGTLNVIGYIGYAVDARYLNGTDAVVLDVIDGNQWVYMLVRSANDTEPRLVRMASTDKNKKDADAAKQQAQQGLVMVRFGENQSGSGDGNGTPADVPDFRIVNLEQTQQFRKDGLPDSDGAQPPNGTP